MTTPLTTDDSPARRLAEALAERDTRLRSVLDPPAADVERVHQRGRLTARERIEMLADPGSEWGFAQTLGRNGMVRGFATIDGRPIAFKAQDVTLRGAASTASARRIGISHNTLIERAALPVFSLFQGAGGVIDLDSLSSSFAGFPGGMLAGAHMAVPRRGGYFTAVLGRAFAPWSVIYSDFAVMTADSTMAIVNPAILEQATGQRTSLEDIAGSAVQARITGQIDHVAEDEEAAIGALRRVFGYLPGSVFEPSPVVRIGDPVDRNCEELRTLVPSYPNRPYDVRKIIEACVDRGSFFELQAEFAKNMVIGLARLGGRTVAIMANQPKHLAGTISTGALTKAYALLRLADCYSLPLVSFCDNPGLFATKDEEHRRILTLATRFAGARARSTIPKITVVIGKGIGFGYFCMSASDTEGYTVAWPNAQIAYIGPEGAVRVAHRKEFEGAEDPRALSDTLAEPYRRYMNPWRGARVGGIDDIIDPAATRATLVRAVAYLAPRTFRSAQR